MSEFLTNAGFGLLRRLGGSILSSLSWSQILVLAAGGLFVLYSMLGGAARLLRRPRFLVIAGAGLAVALLFTGWAAKPRIPGLMAADGPTSELAAQGDEPVMASQLVEPSADSGVLSDLAAMGGVTPPPATAIGLAPAGLGLVPSLLPTTIAPAVGVTHASPPTPAAAASPASTAKGGETKPAPAAARAAQHPTRVAPRGFNTATGRPRATNPATAGTSGAPGGGQNRRGFSFNTAPQGCTATNRPAGNARGFAGSYGTAGSFGAARPYSPPRAPSQATLNRMASIQMDAYMGGMMQQQFGGGGIHPMGGMHPAAGHPAAHHAGHH